MDTLANSEMRQNPFATQNKEKSLSTTIFQILLSQTGQKLLHINILYIGESFQD